MTYCAFDADTECVALAEKKCAGCTFRKTSEQLKEGRQKAEKRIRTLPLFTQLHIHRKYYSRRRSLD
jgi:hypothetical protein